MRTRGQLVVAGRVETQAEGGDRLPGRAGHQADDGVRIDVPGQERPERDVRHQLGRHRPRERLAERRRGLVVVPPPDRHRRRIPVPLDLHGAALVDQVVGRRQVSHVGEDGPGGEDVPVGQELVERLEVHLARDFRPYQQGLHLGAEQEALGRLRVEERLLAGPVAAGEQAAVVRVPQREGEHPPQPGQDVDAERLVAVQHHLDVRAAAKPVPPRDQLAAKLGVVVDLPVGDEMGRSVLARERLLTVGDVDDRQPPHAEAHPRTHELTVLVGSPVTQGLDHAIDLGRIHRAGRVTFDDAGDTGHESGWRKRAMQPPAGPAPAAR